MGCKSTFVLHMSRTAGFKCRLNITVNTCATPSNLSCLCGNLLGDLYESREVLSRVCSHSGVRAGRGVGAWVMDMADCHRTAKLIVEFLLEFKLGRREGENFLKTVGKGKAVGRKRHVPTSPLTQTPHSARSSLRPRTPGSDQSTSFNLCCDKPGNSGENGR